MTMITLGKASEVTKGGIPAPTQDVMNQRPF